MVGLQASYRFDMPADSWLKAAKLSVNVTNLNDIKGISTAVVTGNSGGYQGFPIPPRMVFVTLDGSF
jgi:outer membrane receptor protein involved in Fe transport